MQERKTKTTLNLRYKEFPFQLSEEILKAVMPQLA
jgi:hypothetical protein